MTLCNHWYVMKRWPADNWKAVGGRQRAKTHSYDSNRFRKLCREGTDHRAKRSKQNFFFNITQLNSRVQWPLVIFQMLLEVVEKLCLWALSRQDETCVCLYACMCVYLYGHMCVSVPEYVWLCMFLCVCMCVLRRERLMDYFLNANIFYLLVILNNIIAE